MFGGRTDLPLKGDATSRYLPWLVAMMVFLAAVSVVAVFVLHGVIASWTHDVSGTVTVQVLEAGGDGGAATTDHRVRQAVDFMRGVPGVIRVRPLPRDKMVALLAPWLGSSAVVRDLPLPRLIAVTIDPDSIGELARIGATLEKSVPGATLDDHRLWLARLVALSRSLEALALGIVLLVGGVTAATVVYATRGGLAVHREVIEVLHLVGAHDDYIAHQFADRAFSLGFGGGLLGLALAVPALWVIGWLAHGAQGGFVPRLVLPLAGYLVVALLPVIAAVLAMLAARATVRGTLARLP
jgi:cell division transport system permease protein